MYGEDKCQDKHSSYHQQCNRCLRLERLNSALSTIIDMFLVRPRDEYNCLRIAPPLSSDSPNMRGIHNGNVVAAGTAVQEELGVTGYARG